MIRFNIVDGTTYVGATSPDGYWNAVLTDGTTWVGRKHPSGATNIFVDTDDSGFFGVNYPNGAMRVVPGESSSSGAIAGGDTVVTQLPLGSSIALLGDSIFRRGANFTDGATRLTAENRHNNELMWCHFKSPRFIHRNWWDPTATAANRIPGYGQSMADSTLMGGLNFGYSSDTASGCLFRTDQVIASNADICVLNAGTNVGTTDGTSEVTINSIQATVEALVAGGVRVILGTVRPRRVSETPTGSEISPASMARILAINSSIRSNWASWGASALWDPWDDLRDPSILEADPLYGSILPAYAIADGVHLSSAGAYAASLTLEPIINNLVSEGRWFDELTDLLTNGSMTGTTGTVGGGFTGTMPTSWTLQNAQGAGQPVTGTVTADSNGLTMTITSSGAGSANTFNTIRLNPSTTISSANFASTDWLVALYEVEVVTPGAILVMAQSTLGQTSTISARGHGQPTSTYNNEPSPMKDFAMTGWISTEPLLAEARTNVNPRLDLAIRQDVAGSCVVRVKQAKLVKVSNPETAFPWVA